MAAETDSKLIDTVNPLDDEPTTPPPTPPGTGGGTVPTGGPYHTHGDPVTGN